MVRGLEVAVTVVQDLELVVVVGDSQCRIQDGNSKVTSNCLNQESSWEVEGDLEPGGEAVSRWIWELSLEILRERKSEVWNAFLLLSERELEIPCCWYEDLCRGTV